MMKKNKLLKVLLIVLAIVSIVCVSGVVRANEASGEDIDIGTFSNITPSKPGDLDTKTITNVSSSILYIIQAVGIAAGVIIIAYMGIKYITSSPEGKAELKKQAYVYILGAAFLILAPTIATQIFKLLK